MRRLTQPGPLLLACLLVAAGGLQGCRVTLRCANGLGSAAAAAAAAESASGRADPEGADAEDVRLVALRNGWPARIERALDRLEVVLGITYPGDLRPRVVLRTFGDERVPYELRADVVEGHRRVVLHVNAEPILGGVEDPDRVLLRALAAGIFEQASQRHGVIPRWVVHMAGIAASGELERELRRIQHRALDGDPAAALVDPEDAGAAVSTGVAALVLLSERGEPRQLRRLLLYVADGDDVGAAMARLAHEPDGAWVRPATLSFRTRLAALDPEPWRILQRAEAAAREAGRAGVLASLPAKIPSEIQEEVKVLRARVAADEGDFDEARTLLRALAADAPGRLRDPAAALALRIRVESHPGGSAELARRLVLALDRDFPASTARRALRQRHPLLGAEEDPRRWLVLMHARLETEGSDTFDLDTLERYARTLLLDHRAGSARRFLETLGARGEAPELAAVKEAVLEAERDPTSASVERNAARVRRWQELRDHQSAQDVRAGGRASQAALDTLLANSRGALRAEGISLAVETLGAPGTIALLRPGWLSDPSGTVKDLRALFGAVPFDILHAELGPEGLTALGIERGEQLWATWTLDMSTTWLEAHPHFLQSIRSTQYPVRRAAFDELASTAPELATPALIGLAISDPAALLRREAVELAGRVGFRALVRRALDDDAWLVREQVARALAAGEGPAALPTLLTLVREDSSIQVRGAAALGLLRLAPSNDQVLDALLRTQVEEESRLRDAIAARLTEVDPDPVVRAIERGWARATQRRKPSKSYLFRTSMLFHRLTKVDLAYYPGATPRELRGMLAQIRAWLSRRPAKGDSEGSQSFIDWERSAGR